jgi:hypothetical protein
MSSLLCECSSSDDEVEHTAHHILWECCLWHDERKLMIDPVMAKSVAVYYSDLVLLLTERPEQTIMYLDGFVIIGPVLENSSRIRSH